MAIRIRKVGGRTVVLCAAKTKEEEGDIYLDDAIHHALTTKFDLDFESMECLKSSCPDPVLAGIAKRIEESK